MSIVEPWPSSTSRPDRGSVVVLASVAGALRVLWVLAVARPPVGLFDPSIYFAAASNIAEGDGYRSLTGTVTSYYPPGYPYFLGVLKWVADLLGLNDGFFTLVGLVQAGLGVFAVIAVAHVGWRLGGRTCCIAAGGILALWPNLIVHTSLLLSETLTIALVTGTLWLLIEALDRSDGPKWALLAGSAALCGAGVLTRPQSALLLFPAAVFALLVSRAAFKLVLVTGGALVTGVVIFVALWGIRSQLVMGHFVVISTNSGDNLCIGFNPNAGGGFAMPEECQSDVAYTDGPDQEVRRDAELKSEAISWASHNLGRIPGLSLSKVRITFSGDHDALRVVESFDEDQFLPSPIRTGIRWVSDLYYYAIIGLGLIGVGLAIARTRLTRDTSVEFSSDRLPVFISWFLVAYLLLGVMVPVLSFGDQRFKVPMAPFFALAAAVTVTSIAGYGRFAVRRSDQMDQPA